MEPVTSAMGEAPVASPALEARGLTKRFGAVLACDAVDLSVHPGEIHGILGQNGAGKSTLMNMFLGLMPPDAGQIFLRGEPVHIGDPFKAASLGIAMVHQHFSLIGPLTVWENLTLGEQGRVDEKRTAAEIREMARRYALDVDPHARVENLTTGQRQRVEIVKCLLRNPDIFILDEPTSVLTAAESLELFAVLRRVVREENRAVLLISHKLDEVLFATDRVSIMRAGRVVAESLTSETSAPELAREMIGREVSLRSVAAAAVGHLESAVAVDPAASAEQPDGHVVLTIRDITAVGPDGRGLLDGVSLQVRAGEIVGLAGIEGNGQKAISDLLSSVLEPKSGYVEVGGERVRAGHPGVMAAAGVGVIPEDRHVSGCVVEMSVAENLVLSDLDAVSSRGLLRRKRLHARAQQLVKDFDIVTASLDAPLRTLSGGNQQRVVLARELSRSPVVLVASQPTRGLDVGAIEYMTGRLKAAAAAGVGVLLISTELEEILELSDRVAVIHRGRIVGEMPRHQLDLERLGLMMGGQAA
jgi:simple sugar transport system ATP-binding protein